MGGVGRCGTAWVGVGRRGAAWGMRSGMSMGEGLRRLGWRGEAQVRRMAVRSGAGVEVGNKWSYDLAFIIRHLHSPRRRSSPPQPSSPLPPFQKHSDSDSSSSSSNAQLLHSTFPPPPTTFALLFCRAPPSSLSASTSRLFLHLLHQLPPPSVIPLPLLPPLVLLGSGPKGDDVL